MTTTATAVLISTTCCNSTLPSSTRFSERSLYAVARPSVYRLSVTLVHRTQAVEVFGNISTALDILAIR